MMKFEYDPNKSAANKIKHGIDFEEAKMAWKDINSTVVLACSDIEPRYAITSVLFDKHWTVIFTYRESAIRIISARRARPREINYYEIRKNNKC